MKSVISKTITITVNDFTIIRFRDSEGKAYIEIKYLNERLHFFGNEKAQGIDKDNYEMAALEFSQALEKVAYDPCDYKTEAKK